MTDMTDTAVSQGIPVDDGRVPAVFRRSLRRNVAIVAAGRAFYAASQFALGMAIAKLGQPGDLGSYKFAVDLSTPVYALMLLKLGTVHATDAKNEYAFGDYAGLRLLTVALGFLVILGIVSIGRYEWTVSVVVLLVAGGQATLTIRDIYHSHIRKMECMEWIGLSSVILGLAAVSGAGLMLWLTKSLVAAVAVLLTVRVIVLLGLDVPAAFTAGRASRVAAGERFAPRFVPASLSRLAWLSAPLGLVGMLVTLNSKVPTYFLKHWHGAEALDYYAGPSILVLAGNILVAAVGMAASPRLAKYFVNNRQAYKKLLVKMILGAVLLSFLAIVLSMVLGRKLLMVCFRPDFAEYHSTLVWLVVGWCAFTFWSFFEQGVTAARRFRIQIPIYALVVVVGVLASWLLVPQYAQVGGGVAIAISNATGAVLMACCLLRVLGKPMMERTADE